MPGTTPPPPARRLRVALGVAILLAVHYLLAVAGAWDKSLTFDETAHIVSGYSFWRLGDYRLEAELAQLSDRWATLPLLFFRDVRFPSPDEPAWHISDHWGMGDLFFHGLGNDGVALLRASRAAMALVGVGLCLAVFLWSRRLFGLSGGFVSLVLCAFSPLILAHGPLAASDATHALLMLLATWSIWSCLRRVTLPTVLGCAATLSALALTKISAILILPIAALLTGEALLLRRKLLVGSGCGKARAVRGAGRRLGVLAGVGLLCGLSVWFAIWLAYSFRYEPYPPEGKATFERYLGPGAPVVTLQEAAARAGLPGRVLLFAGEHRLLPEAYLYGAGCVLISLRRSAFLNGEYSHDGWRHFFPYCFLVKSTLPMLLLTAVAAGALLASLLRRGRGSRMRRGRVCAALPLWSALAVLWAVLVQSTLNIGARHMLAVLPPTFVLCGAVARIRPRRGLLWWPAALLLWHVGEGVRGFPHYLAYFNQITGRTHAYRHLVESSLDWGQDLPGLKAWLDRRLAAGPPAPVYLSYFGTGSPAYYGIAAEPLELEERADAGLPSLGRAGIYCVSATNLQGVYAPVPGRWSAEREAEYRFLGSAASSPEQLRRLHELGTARLMAYLRGREPDHHVGFSILVYELSEEDLRLAIEGPPPDRGG